MGLKASSYAHRNQSAANGKCDANRCRKHAWTDLLSRHGGQLPCREEHDTTQACKADAGNTVRKLHDIDLYETVGGADAQALKWR